MALTQQIGRAGLGFLQALTKPFRKGVGIGTKVSRGIAQKATGRKLTPEQEKGLQQLERMFLSEQERKGIAEKPLLETGAKTLAGQASFFVPGGQVTKLGKLGAGAAAGALAGFGESERGKELEATIGGAGLGGGLAGAGIVAGKVGGLFKGASKTGSKLRQGVRKPEVAKTPFAATEERKISSVLDELGFKGSAESQKQRLPKAFQELTDQIKERVAKDKTTVSPNRVKNKLEETINDLINFDESIPSFNKAKTKFLNQIDKQITSKGTIQIKDLVTIKKKLSEQLGKAFTKIDKGNPLTPQEEVGLAVWESVDDLLPKGIKELSRKQSTLFKAAPGILKQADKPGGVPLPLPGGGISGIRVGKGITQAGADVAGRALQQTGQTATGLQGALQGLPPQLQRAIQAAAIPTIVGQTTQQPAPQDSQLPVEGQADGQVDRTQLDPQRQQALDIIDQAEAQAGQAGGIAGIPQITPQMAAMAQLMLSSKDAAKVKAAFDLQQKEAPTKKLTAGEKKNVRLAQSSIRALDEIEKILEEDPQVVVKAALPGAPGARKYDSAAFRAVEGLLRARSGAAVPEEEVRRYINANLPRVGDAPDTARFKLDAFRKDLEAEANPIAGTQDPLDALRSVGLNI